MEHDTAYELYFVVGHVPLHFVAAGHPAVFPYSFVALDGDELAALTGEVAVELGCGHLDGVACSESLCCLAHGGEDEGKIFIEFVFDDVEDFLLVSINLVPERLALVERQSLYFGAQFCYGFVVGFCCLGDIGAYTVDTCAQTVVVEFLNLGHLLLDFCKNGLDCLEVAGRLVAE